LAALPAVAVAAAVVAVVVTMMKLALKSPDVIPGQIRCHYYHNQD
jgi:hypothetical protein